MLKYLFSFTALTVCQKLLTKESRTKHTVVEGPNHILHCLGLLLLPIVIVLYLIFWVFRILVSIYLYLKLGNQFHGLLRICDAIWVHDQKEWRNIIPIIYFVSSDKEIDALKNTKALLKERVFKCSKDYRKLTSTYKKFLGYVYLEYDTYTLDECVTQMDFPDLDSNYITEDNLKEFVNKYGQATLPKHDRALWQIYVSSKPLIQKKSNGEQSYVYPLLIKMHHMVGDGAAMVSFTEKIWGDDSNQFNYLDKIFKNKMNNKTTPKDFFDFEHNIFKLLKLINHYLRLVYVWMGTLLFLLYVRKGDKNALHGPKLTGEKITTWAWEDERDLVPLVKKIKNSVPKATFNDVVYTALSGCISNYYERNNFNKPEYFYTALPVILSLRNLGKPGPAELKNDFSMNFFKLPSKKDKLMDTFVAVQEQFDHLKNNLDSLEINYLTFNYLLSPFPLPLIMLVCVVSGVTFATSNLPGGTKGKTLGGYDIHNLIFFTLNRWRTGVTGAVITYDDRFHVSFLIDKALISSKKEVQNINNDFFKNIKLLAEELKIKV